MWWIFNGGRRLATLERKVLDIMDKLDTEVQKVKDLEAKFDTFVGNVGTSFQTIKDEVATLKAQIAAGTDTTALDAALQEMDDHLSAAVVPTE